MKFGKGVINRASSPGFKLPSDEEGDGVKIKASLKLLRVEIELILKIEEADELIIKEIYYKTVLSNNFLGVVDGFIERLHGVAVEGADRITVKDLDHFLRDEPSVPSFQFYGPELYEILSLGEEIRRHFSKKEEAAEEILFDPSIHGEFFDISFSEQIDFLEEIFSKYIYSNQKYHQIDVEVNDVSEKRIEVKIEAKEDKELGTVLSQAISKELKVDLTVVAISWQV